uniref:IgA FC receptor n=1 Tax=Haemonchus contortus TaxID=6289 RepID=A0A7I4YJA9_HAECO
MQGDRMQIGEGTTYKANIETFQPEDEINTWPSETTLPSEEPSLSIDEATTTPSETTLRTEETSQSDSETSKRLPETPLQSGRSKDPRKAKCFPAACATCMPICTYVPWVPAVPVAPPPVAPVPVAPVPVAPVPVAPWNPLWPGLPVPPVPVQPKPNPNPPAPKDDDNKPPQPQPAQPPKPGFGIGGFLPLGPWGPAIWFNFNKN